MNFRLKLLFAIMFPLLLITPVGMVGSYALLRVSRQYQAMYQHHRSLRGHMVQLFSLERAFIADGETAHTRAVARTLADLRQGLRKFSVAADPDPLSALEAYEQQYEIFALQTINAYSLRAQLEQISQRIEGILLQGQGTGVFVRLEAPIERLRLAIAESDHLRAEVSAQEIQTLLEGLRQDLSEPEHRLQLQRLTHETQAYITQGLRFTAEQEDHNRPSEALRAHLLHLEEGVRAAFAKMNQRLQAWSSAIVATVFWSSLAALGLGFLIAGWISKQLSRPLKSIQEVVSQMREDNFSTRIEAHSRDELGVLGQAFNHLAERLSESFAALKRSNQELSQYRASLEEQVAQRTHALSVSEAEYRQLFESMVAGFALNQILFNQDGRAIDFRFLRINPAFEKLTGLSSKETVGRNFHDLDPQGHEWVELFAGVAQSGQAIHVERYWPHSGRWYEVTAYSLYDAVIAVTFTDITQRRELESYLQQQQKMQAIGQLAGGIAHDFNNQLAGIIGFAEQLRESVYDARSRNAVERVLTAAQRAAGLTAQLLAFAHKGNYEKVPVGMHAIISETVEILQRSMDPRIVVEQLLRAQQDTVFGDATQLQNALLNVCLNARDAMPEGGSLVLATGTENISDLKQANPFPELAPGAYFSLRISDSGCGIAKEIQQRIFEPFFTTKEVGRGTGMGLASVFGTMQSHKGCVRVESIEGQGTTFHLLLPLSEEAKVANPVLSSAVERVDENRAEHILVVDDEALLRELLEEMLEELGYQVASVSNGKEAVAYVQEHADHIDCVLLDMVMPEMNGTDTFYAIRRIVPDLRVLLLSGYSVEGQAQELLEAGAQGFIHKPFTRQQLLETLRVRRD